MKFGFTHYRGEVDGIGDGIFDLFHAAFRPNDSELFRRYIIMFQLVALRGGAGEAHLYGYGKLGALFELQPDLSRYGALQPHAGRHTDVLFIDLKGPLARLVNAGEIQDYGRLRGAEVGDLL